MDEPDDTDMSPEEFRAALARGTPVRIVASRNEFEKAVSEGYEPLAQNEFGVDDLRRRPSNTPEVVQETAIPWRELDGSRAEKFISILLLREYPDALRDRPTRGDDGMDVIVPVSDSPRRYDVYQIKSYHQRLNETQRSSIERSARRAIERARSGSINLRSWHLVVPLDPSPQDTEWIDTLFEDSSISAHWNGKTYLQRLARKYSDVVNYYIRGNRDELTSLVESALELVRATAPAEEADIADELEYKALWTALDRLNIEDPHYTYSLSINHGEPDFYSAPESAVMSQFAGRLGGSTMRIDVYPKYRLAVEDRPITASLRLRIPDSESDLRTAVARFNTHGDELEVPAQYASATIDDPIYGSTDYESLSVRISPLPATPRRLRYLILEETGERVASAFFNVVSRDESASGRGLRVKLRSDSGLISLEHWLERSDDRNYRGGFNFQLDWKERIAARVLDELLFGHSMIKPRRLVMAREFTGPFVEVAYLHELTRPAVPDWLVTYAHALNSLQDYADVPLRMVGPENDEDSSSIEQVIRIASILHGRILGQRAPQISIVAEGADAQELVQSVESSGELRMVAPFTARVANGRISIPRVTFAAENVQARLETAGESTRVVLTRPGGEVVVRVYLDPDESAK
jgi:hypothetical protein